MNTLAIKMATDPAQAAAMLKRAFAAAGDAPGAVDRVAQALGASRRSIYRYDERLVAEGYLEQSLLPWRPTGAGPGRPRKAG